MKRRDCMGKCGPASLASLHDRSIELPGKCTSRGDTTGFTLLEVLLAMMIATGLMVVAVYFYQQIGELRSQSVREIQKLSTLRLLMDKLTTDLRSAHSLGYFESGFVGGPDYVQFVKAEVPAMASWTDDVGMAGAPPESDLMRVGYTLVVSLADTNQTGSLMRWEEPNWPEAISATLLEGDLQGEPLESESAGDTESNTGATNVIEAGSTIFTDHVQYVHFRYFDGTAWLPTWDGIGLPLGVEIQMSPEAWMETESDVGSLETMMADEYPDPLFRRLVFVPGNRADFEAPEDLSWMEDAVASGTTNEPGPTAESEVLPP